uniref:Major capsid protein n=1 Tax=Panagrellus redivivus TaxID=6233 RepID=A0A7E4V452_PANRE
MFQVYNQPVWFDVAGWTFRRFTGDAWNFYTVNSIPELVNTYDPNLLVFANRITTQFYRAIPYQPYFNRFPYTNFVKESLLMYPNREAAVHLGFHHERQEYCTIREVFTTHNLVSDPENHRAVMTGMALELHILQHVRDHNIITLLSIERDIPHARHILMYELSIPLLYYIRERAFVNSISVFEDENIPKYIIVCVLRALQKIFTYDICLNGKISTQGIYIDYIGRVKLGSFLHAIKSDDPFVKKKDLPAVGGIYTALVNRTLRNARVKEITNLYPIDAIHFSNAYFNAQSAFPVYEGEENDYLSPENLEIVIRSLHGPAGYFNNLVARFDLQNVPNMSADLAELIQNTAQYFTDPMLNEDILAEVPPQLVPQRHPRCSLIYIKITIDINYQHSAIYYLQSFNDYADRKLLNIINSYLNRDPVRTMPINHPMVDEDVDHNMIPEAPEGAPLQAVPANDVPDYLQNIFSGSFIASDILILYPVFVRLFNEIVNYVEDAPLPWIPIIHGIYGSLDSMGARNFTVRMRLLGGIPAPAPLADEMIPVVPDDDDMMADNDDEFASEDEEMGEMIPVVPDDDDMMADNVDEFENEIEDEYEDEDDDE